MYRKVLNRVLVAVMLLSGFQLPVNSGLANAAVTEELPVSAAAQMPKFTDMEQHWAASAADRLAAAGILQGTATGRFEPDRAVSRAELAAILSRVFRYTATGIAGFNDVSASSWYAVEVSKVNEAGIIKGYGNGQFQPDAAVRREDAMTMLARAFRLETPSQDMLNVQADWAAVSAYAREAASAMLASGYVQGDPAGKLNPKSEMTRGELAVLLSRMIGWISPAGGTIL